MKNRPKKPNPPREAREAIPGMRRIDLASRAGISLMTVYRAEASGQWPSHELTCRAYKAALGLVAPVSFKPTPSLTENK